MSLADMVILSRRVYDAIEAVQDATDRLPDMVERMHGVLDLLVEYQGVIGERRRNATATGEDITDGVSASGGEVG